jgi:hypothetical protein
MNGRTFLKLGALIIILTFVLSGIGVAQVRYLNVTDGDDSYTGVNATNNPIGTGPKRTFEAAFRDFPSGATVHVAAGLYNINQSAIAGGNDADGVSLTQTNKSMTFIVESYNLNDVVTIGGAGPLVINCGTGTITFQPATTANGVLVGSAATGITLTSGTLDVTAMGTKFTVAATATLISRAAGALVGTPSYPGSAYDVTYTGTATRNAGGEIPGTLAFLRMNQTAGTVTFANAMTFPANGNGILTSAGGPSSAVFNGAVTLKSATLITSTATIVNSTGSTWTFNGGINIVSRTAANGTPISNTAGGTISVPGPVSVSQQPTGTIAVDFQDGFHTSLFSNSGAGALRLTGGISETNTTSPPYSAVFTPVVNVENTNTGTLVLGGTAATTVTGTLTTGAVAGVVNIAGDVTVKGVLTNGAGHLIALGANTLTLSGTVGHTNNGTISSSGVGSGLLNITGTGAKSITGPGALPNLTNAGSGALTLTGVMLINGNLTGAGGNITISTAGAVVISGALNVSSGTVTTSTTGSALTVNLTTSLSGGQLTMGGTVTVFGDFSQTGGTLNFGGPADNLLDLKRNFNRTTGAVTSAPALADGTPASGIFQFSGGGPQTFAGGANFTVWDFKIVAVGTGVTFTSGSIIVNRDVVVEANTNIILSTFNIRMRGPLVGGIPPSFIHGGQYSATGGGGVLFENPSAGGIAGTPQIAATIGGTGVYSNIEVRLQNEYDVVDVKGGTVVTWSGILTLTRGTIQTTATTQFNPSTLITTPTIRRNLQDGPLAAAGDEDGAPDGKSILVAGGNFNATGVSYNLEYFGALLANTSVNAGGVEFITGATPRVINLTINTTGAFSVDLTDALYMFTGNLTIVAHATLRFTTTALNNNPLVSTGSNVTHTIAGTLSRQNANGGFFRLDGTGVTINGGDNSSAGASESWITATTISPGAVVTVVGVRRFTDGVTNTGTLNLGLAKVNGDASSGIIDEGTSTNAYSQASTLNLTADAEISGPVVHSDGSINLFNFNLKITGPSYTRAAVATAVYTDAPTTTTNGFLILSFATMTFDFNQGTGAGGQVPRLNIAASVQFLSNAEVTDRYRHTGGTVDLNGKTLIISGTVWAQELSGAVYTVSGTIRVTGTTTLYVGVPTAGSSNVTVPNVTVATSTTFAIVNNGPNAWATVSIALVLTQTSGTISLGGNDVDFIQSAANVYTYVSGTVVGTSSAIVDNTPIGEFKFGGGNATGTQMITLTNNGLTISNVKFRNSNNTTAYTGVQFANGTTTMTITNRLTFGAWGASVVNSPDGNKSASRITLADGAWIHRLGTNGPTAGTLDAAPVFAGKVNLAYMQYTMTTGVELPTAVDKINNLYISPDMAVNEGYVGVWSAVGQTITFGALATTTPVVVNGTLTLGSGFLAYGASRPLQIANGATVRVESNVFTGVPGAINPAAGTAALAPLGTYKLVYAGDDGTGGYSSTNKEWIDTKVSDLTVVMGTPIFAVAATNDRLFVHAGRTVTNFVLNCGAIPAGLDLTDITGTYGSMLTVTGMTTLTKGTIYNGGAFAAGVLNVQGDISLATNGRFAPSTNLMFSGANNQTFTLAGPSTLASVTLNKTVGTSPVPRIVLASPITDGTTLTIGVGGVIAFLNGLLITGNNTVVLPTVTQGFTRPAGGIPPPNASHVVGNVRKNPGMAFVGRLEYPIGTSGNVRDATPRYRPVAITFLPGNPLITAAGIIFTHIDSDPNPGGVNIGLPIDAGSFVRITGHAPFYWMGTSTVGLGPSQTFDLEVWGEGFTSYPLGSFGIGQLRIIRRFDGSEEDNSWVLQGGSNYTNYVTNEPVAGTPVVRVIGSSGGIEVARSRFTIGTGFITGVALEKSGIPTEYNLAQNYPNPFNPSTQINFDLPKQSPVTLEIYDMLGQKVRTLISGDMMDPGYYHVTWSGTNQYGNSVASGVYYYRIVADKFTSLKKMMFLK